MENAWIVMRQTFLLFLYMGVGALLFRRGLITREGSRSLAGLLLYAVLPSAIVRSFLTERTAEKCAALGVSILAAAGILLLSMVVSHLLFRRDAVADFSAAFSNAGFMGFPLVTAVLGQEALFYAAGFVALLNVLQWTYGQRLLAPQQVRLSPRSVLANPLMVAMLTGLALFLLQVPVPALLQSALGSMAALNAPLAMVILGVYLAQTSRRTLFGQPAVYAVAAVRLLLIPLLSWAVLRLLPAPYADLRSALFIVACAPVGANVAVYAQRMGRDPTYAVSCVALSTVCSIVTMPLLMLLL